MFQMKDTTTMATTKTARETAKAKYYMTMAIAMRELGLIARNMGKVNSGKEMVGNRTTREVSKKIRWMGKARLSMKTVRFMRVTG